jgi:endonuclease YncB( thermonuclease family)
VIRASDGLNVNVFLVAQGDAAPYFYHGREGRYAPTLDHDAMRARSEHLGLWGACPRTPVNFDRGRGVATGPAA